VSKGVVVRHETSESHGVEEWEYLSILVSEAGRLADLGRAGWELVAAAPAGGETRLYLKRPRPGLRERVTLEQRARVYESRGLDPQDAAGEGAP
jgi:hypothetical protein